MTYDFTTLPDRWDTGAEKYELMKKRCPDVPRGTVPFSVADRDFRGQIGTRTIILGPMFEKVFLYQWP